MPKIINLSGQIFGRLTVIKRQEGDRPGYLSTFWECKCTCGNTTSVHIANLRLTGATKSCGCINKEIVTTHGLSFTQEYVVWGGIVQRCYNFKANNYHNYGGRGIIMSDEWRNDFQTFYNDMGPRPSDNHTVERNNTDGNYCKSNCKWATRIEQANNKRTTVYYELVGERKTLANWCRELCISYRAVYKRLKKGIDFEDALDDVISKNKLNPNYLRHAK